MSLLHLFYLDVPDSVDLKQKDGQNTTEKKECPNLEPKWNCK